MSNRKILSLFLVFCFGITWLLAIFLVIYGDALSPYLGRLSLFHPLVMLALCSPSLVGLTMVCYLYGFRGLGLYIAQLGSEKKYLAIYFYLLLVCITFLLSVRWLSIFIGWEVPEMDRPLYDQLILLLRNFFEEVGLIGGLFGWIGLVLPLLQQKYGILLAGLLTGAIWGFWTLPGFLVSDLDTGATSPLFILYVTQLSLFVGFQSYIFAITKGSLGYYLFSFGIISAGSRLGFYYFNTHTQILQISFFLLAIIFVRFLVRHNSIVTPKFPQYFLEESWLKGASK